MPRQIDLHLSRSGAVAIATLLDDRASQTADAIWAALTSPVERQLLHAIISGQNVAFYDFPPVTDGTPLPLENHTVRPRPGDILYFFQPAGRLEAMESTAPGLDLIDGLAPMTRDTHELLFSYGETDLRGPSVAGWRGSHFATITEGLGAFGRACIDMRIHGAETITLSRRQA